MFHVELLKKYLFIFFVLCFSCNDNKLDEGYYLKKDYLEYQDAISQKSFELNQSDILLKISNDTIYHWGDIQYWKRYYINKNFPLKKILFNGIPKYFLESEYNGLKESFEYIKFDSITPPLDSLGLDFSVLEKMKSNKILLGEYNLNGKRILFKKNGAVHGLNEFTKYQIYLRGGTNFPYSGLNFIKTDKGIWKFNISKNKLILRKYSDERNPITEMYGLSNKKIELIKL
jgi:hypothetical protein